MAKRVVLVRHGDDPPDDRVYTYLAANGFEIDLRRPYQGDMLGDVDESLAGTVLYGGPFNAFATEEHPFLKEEYRWIAECLAADVPMLGICQGAQQIALHLGAEVGPKPGVPHEFGYYRIEPTDEGKDFLPGPCWFTQAHFHTFDIPEGAIHLAKSAAFENQAFRYGDKVYGLQYHPEVTPQGFRRWQDDKTAAYGKPGAQTREEQDRLQAEHDDAQDAWFQQFMGSLFGVAKSRAETAA